MAEKNLESLLKAVTVKLVSKEEKSIVEMYLLNRDNLSPEARERAAGIINTVLSEYPEIASTHKYSCDSEKKAKKIDPKLVHCKQELEALQKEYEHFSDNAADSGYKPCCYDTMLLYEAAANEEISNLKTRLGQIDEIAKHLQEGSLDKFDFEHWSRVLQEKKDLLERFRKNYARNKFVMHDEKWGSFHFLDSPHRKPHDKE